MATKYRRYLTPLEIEAIEARTLEDGKATEPIDQRLRAGEITLREAEAARSAIYRAGELKLKQRLAR